MPHDQAKLVGQVEKLRAGHIMGGADRVDALRLQGGQALAPERERDGSPHRTAIMMQRNALQLEIAAIEPETGRRIEARFANAEADMTQRQARVPPPATASASSAHHGASAGST